ncbi:MAG: twin-arginine translocase subunit TatC [Dehalococcoidia bacterium]
MGRRKNPNQLTIIEHLSELRGRLIKSVIALVVGTAIAAGLTFPILRFLKGPAGDRALVYIDPTELIGTYFKVAIVGGLILAMPVILYQVAMFIAPGMTSREKRYLTAVLPAVVLSFAAGVVFAWFILIPPALDFLLNFGSSVAEPQIRISRYINLILILSFWVGISFQTPLVMLIFARLGIVSPKGFARRRKYAFLGAFVAGAIVTPTFDPINQTLLASPIFVLYEVGIWLARIASWQRRRAAARSKAGMIEAGH